MPPSSAASVEKEKIDTFLCYHLEQYVLGKSKKSFVIIMVASRSTYRQSLSRVWFDWKLKKRLHYAVQAHRTESVQNSEKVAKISRKIGPPAISNIDSLIRRYLHQYEE